MLPSWCRRIVALGVFVLGVMPCLVLSDMPTDEELRKKPISEDKGEIGNLLRGWFKEGRAAGNVGDWYDNRDGEHSPLDLKPYPQLRKVSYSAEDLKARRNWALQPKLLPHVVFGNSSTSAPPTLSGSNPRSYYCAPDGLRLLEQHYLKNNLYIYPEHRDHDPGHNGLGDGYGDLLPTNTPYLLISQGSSGSDQPFMKALPVTLAAIRPEVKKKLIESGLLMPTIQYIVRRSNKNIVKDEDYFSAKAHPTVFEGSNVDPLAMIRRANAMTLESIVPLVKLEVLEEDKIEPGADYFEPAWIGNEKLADTSSVVARLWRGKQATRRIVLSTEKSLEVNKKPLTYRWVVLRGDAAKIQIKPLNKANSEVELTVSFHPRRPISPGSALESTRVDIGVFAENGVSVSPPAFVTFFSFDNEVRIYDDKGQIREIAYGPGTCEIRVSNGKATLEHLVKDAFAAKVLKLDPKHRDELAKILERWDDKKSLETKNDILGLSPRNYLSQLFAKTLAIEQLRDTQKAEWQKREIGNRRIATAETKIRQLGLKLTPKDAKGSKETSFAKAMFAYLDAVRVSEVLFPGSAVVYSPNLVDARLTTPKTWRDVYQYEGEKLTGWTRYHVGKDKPSKFTAEGWLIEGEDEKGRAIRARPVVYKQGSQTKGSWINTQPLEIEAGAEVIHIEYDGDKRIIKR
jgi:hypothetical protein